MAMKKETRADEVVLYDYPISYNCQIVRLVLCEKGVPGKTIRVDIGPMMEQFTPNFMRLNPSGQVPVLLHQNKVVTQTLEIMYYLDQHLPGTRLIPLATENRAAMEKWVAMERAFPEADFTYGLVEQGTGKIVARDMERRKRLIEKYMAVNPDLADSYKLKLEAVVDWQMRLRDPDLVDRLVDQIHKMLDELEKQVAGRNFIVTENYTLADVVWTAFLARLEMVGFKRMWSLGARPNIEEYYIRMKQRPSFACAPIHLKSSLWLVIVSAIKVFRLQLSLLLGVGIIALLSVSASF